MDLLDEYLKKFMNIISKNKINNINIIDYTPLKLIYTDNLYQNLHHNDDIIDFIIHNIDFIISDNDYNIISYVTKNYILNDTNREEIIKNWNLCNVYYNYIGLYTIFFIYNDTKYIALKYKIEKFDDSYFNTFCSKLYDNYIKPVHKIVNYNKLKFILSYDTSNNVIDKKIYDLTDNKLFFESFEKMDDEYYSSLKYSEITKKLRNGGFIICYDNKKYIYVNKIYEKLNIILPKFTNINKIYLELYKNNNLNKVINYLTPYSYDVIKRINFAMKTLSKEYLNIYHLTRKKSNPLLYDKMNTENKKILYELHTIFINTRKNEYILNSEFVDKKSLNVDIVYNYLKKLPIEHLEKIFIEREKLILSTKDTLTDKNFKIFFEDCINVKTMAYLLNK